MTFSGATNIRIFSREIRGNNFFVKTEVTRPGIRRHGGTCWNKRRAGLSSAYMNPRHHITWLGDKSWKGGMMLRSQESWGRSLSSHCHETPPSGHPKARRQELCRKDLQRGQITWSLIDERLTEWLAITRVITEETHHDAHWWALISERSPASAHGWAEERMYIIIGKKPLWFLVFTLSYNPLLGITTSCYQLLLTLCCIKCYRWISVKINQSSPRSQQPYPPSLAKVLFFFSY